MKFYSDIMLILSQKQSLEISKETTFKRAGFSEIILPSLLILLPKQW